MRYKQNHTKFYNLILHPVDSISRRSKFSDFRINRWISLNWSVAKISCDKWYARHAVFGTKSGDESVSFVVRGITDSQHFVIDLFDPRIVIRQYSSWTIWTPTSRWRPFTGSAYTSLFFFSSKRKQDMITSLNIQNSVTFKGIELQQLSASHLWPSLSSPTTFHCYILRPVRLCQSQRVRLLRDMKQK